MASSKQFGFLALAEMFLVVFCVRHVTGAVTFPQQSNALVIYPMNSAHYCNDVSGRGYHCNYWEGNSTSYARFTYGPFGDSNGAMIPYSNSWSLFRRENWAISLNSFTVSFFYKVGRTGVGSIMQFRSNINTNYVFSLYYADQTKLGIRANNVEIARLSALHYTVWTYISLSYNDSNGQLSIYNRHGLIYSASYQPDIRSSNVFSNYGIDVGFTNFASGMYPTDAMACLSVYRTPLTAGEVMELHDACRAVLGAPPCGTPRLALTSVPSVSTTVPKTGQFPWTASLLSGATHICSASILDQYWLVTAARCFKETTSPSVYTVIVGEFDLDVTEPYQRNHSISKIILSPNSSSSNLIGELALILLNDPIDLINTYVNNICPFRGDNSQLNIIENAYMFGWGANGRSPIVSQTLPRYVNSKILSDTQCKQQLGSKYNSTYHYCFVGNNPDFTVPCIGDEGSGLLVPTNDYSSSKGIGPYLVEMAIFVQRESGCAALSPGIFAKMVPYVPWITQQIACAIPSANDFPTSCPQKAPSPCGC